MSHLGRWLSALIDGELEPEERDRVLNHLAGCQPCLREANAMRALKRRLTALGDPAGTDAAIVGRLIELARGDDEPSDGDRSRNVLPSRPYAATKRSSRGRSRLQVPGWLMLAGSTGTAIVAFGFAAFLLGSGQDDTPAPKITPSVDSFLLQHYYDTGVAPAVRTGSGAPPALDNPAMLNVRQHGAGRATPALPDAAPGGGQFFVGQLVAGETIPVPSVTGQSGPGSAQPGSGASPVASAVPAPTATASPSAPSPSASGQLPGSDTRFHT